MFKILQARIMLKRANRKRQEIAENQDEILPNGMPRYIKVRLNPEPNLHLNIGKHLGELVMNESLKEEWKE